ncbi:unnamed protein product [Somion occarium]|uniref:RING-type domain-containing protein n=1 Tax=Somion occarium TaxID=3059160 RepID=A0ABP1E2F9_9APHY
MGQSNSRARTSRPLSTASTQGRDSSAVDGTPSNDIERSVSHDSQRAVTKRRSRRLSLRRSVLGLVSRSSSSTSLPHPKDSSPSRRPHHSIRKRWRSSKRLSHPPDVPQPEEVPTAADVPNPPEVVERTLDSEPASKAGPSSTSSSHNTPLRGSRPSTPFPISRPTTPIAELPVDASTEGLSEQERQLSQNIGAWLSGATPQPSPSPTPVPVPPHNEDIEQEINQFLNADVHANGEATSSPPVVPSQSTPAATEPNSQPSQVPRHFPPPGTLVVVQGVVNTTDAPQPSNTSNPSSSRPSEGNSTSAPVRQRSASLPRSHHRLDERPRSSLASLLPRPHSMISSRPPSDVNLSQGPATVSSDASSNDNPSPSSEDSSRTGDTQDTTPNTSETGHRALSPGSIDVLGTLLSVAATATAASLFSPGLAQASNGSSSASQTISGTDRPTSPTPTAGLGALGGLNGLSGLNFNPPGSTPGDRDARERIRNVWESFRERLGLNARPTPGTGPVGNTDAASTSNARMRPGELMLAEMARALNAGLGLAGQGGQNERQSGEQSSENANANSDAPTAPTDNESNRPVSPEAGFERFLLNLQADLRTILSNDGVTSSNSDSTVEATSPAESTAVREDADQPRPEDIPVASSSSDSQVQDSACNGEDDEDIPALQTESEDESEDEDSEDGEEITEAVPPHPRTPTPIPTSRLQQQARPSGDDAWGTDDRGRPTINLWRIYRFQPIPAPPNPITHAARTTPIPVPTEQESTPLPQPSPSEAEADLSAQTSTSSNTEDMPSAPSEPEPNVVVPVIVVGLQSVDTGHDREHDDDWPAHEATRNTASTDDGPSLSAPGARPPTPRGRTWQSRAANALRTLRPGRRNGSTRRAADVTGSRTFLIYVIGGYYPPNHHMVTGSDSLDSYEALWELAELLGQVKPPVATKEDIEKSGLQIIKASAMKRYEGEGKISSNCMDRCLVCLDDFDDEDDVRVMTCKHAFHRECVDRWLQVGRNNCPACRTKGVSTPTDSTPTPVS